MHWSTYLLRIYFTIKYYYSFWIYSFVKICGRRKKHSNITGTMYVIIYRNAATKNSLPKRLLQFTKLEYMGAFATHNLLSKKTCKVWSKNSIFTSRVGNYTIYDNGFRYFLEYVFFLVILKTPRTANFLAVLILTSLKEI